MHLNLICYQLKIDSHNKTFYKSLIVTRKQEPTIVTQKRKRKESKHTTTENHQITSKC